MMIGILYKLHLTIVLLVTPIYGNNQISFCPVGKEYNGSCYLLVETSKSWFDAGTDCRLRTGTLAVIKNQPTNTFISKLTQSKFSWIGASNADTEGSWKWPDGENVVFTNWDMDQPDNFLGNENCAAINHATIGAWADDNCNKKHPYVCQIPKISPGILPGDQFQFPGFIKEKVGAEIEIQCTPPNPSDNIAAWFKNGLEYDPPDDPNVIITKQTQPGDRSYLQILNARIEDSSNFTCMVKNGVGKLEISRSEVIIYDVENIKLINCDLKPLITNNDDGDTPNGLIEIYEDQAILNLIMDFSKSSFLSMSQVNILIMNEIVLIEPGRQTNYSTCNKIDEKCKIRLPILLTSKEIEIILWLNDLEKCHQEFISIKEIQKDDDWFKYSPWTEWSGCSVGCGEGTKSRNRDCRIGQLKYCQPKYKENLIEVTNCLGNDRKCQGMYEKWGEWGPCNVSCIRSKNQPGETNRTRKCQDGSNCEEQGMIEIKRCFGLLDFKFCPFDCPLNTQKTKSHIIQTRYDLTVQLMKSDDPIKEQSILLRKSGSNSEAAVVTWDMSKSKTCMDAKPRKSDLINYNCYEDNLKNCVCTFHALRMTKIYKLTKIYLESITSDPDVLDPRFCPDISVEEHNWECKNGETVLFSQLCDSTNDCTDGSDEEDVICKGSALSLLKVGVPLSSLFGMEVIIACLLILFSIQYKKHDKYTFVTPVIVKEFFEKVHANGKLGRSNAKIIRSMKVKDIEQVIKISSTMEFCIHRKVLKAIRKEFGQRNLLRFVFSSMENRSELKAAFGIIKPGFTDRLSHFIKLKIPLSQMVTMTHASEVTSASLFALLTFSDFYKDYLVIVNLHYFINEILQHNFARIGYLRLNHVFYLLLGILVFNMLLKIWVDIAKFPAKVIHMNKYLKVLIIIPGFYSILHAAVCICLSWNILISKLELAKLSAEEWTDDSWNAKLKHVRIIHSFNEKMEVMCSKTRFIKGCENVLENFFQATVSIMLVLRGKIFNFFQSTMLKDLPSAFTLLSIYSILSIIFKVRNFKSGNKEGFLSFGGIVQVLAICSGMLQKTVLYMVASYQYPFIVVIVLSFTSIVIFSLNEIYNIKFASSTLVDRIVFSIIAALVPITFTDWKMVDISDEENEKLEFHIKYGRKRTISQGFSIHFIHVLESALLITIIAAQKHLDEYYLSSLGSFLDEHDIGVTLPFMVVLLLLSVCCHVMAGIFKFIYYRLLHPWKSITTQYPMFKSIGICPKIVTYEEDFTFEVQDEEENALAN